MAKMEINRPIGLFDSGIGGLTIAHELFKHLPNEDMIYFGDTAHLPYGEKSAQAIINYASKIAEFLLSHHVKIIVIACNSASSVAYDYLQNTIGDQVLIVNVIDPIVQAIKNQATKQTLGLIGTRRTITSGSYQQQFNSYGYEVKVQATPLLAAAIEEGFAGTPIMQQLIQHYLQVPALDKIDNLILGCTHYPLIKHEIAQYYQQQGCSHICVTDPSTIVAMHIKDILIQHDIQNKIPHTESMRQCYLSDVTPSFVNAAPLFFSAPIDIVKYPLWD